MKKGLYFIMFLICMIFFNLTSDIFVLLIVMTMHEMSHVLLAKKFGLKAKGFFTTPMGQIVVITDIEFLRIHKKFLIYFIGSFVNIIFYIAMDFLFADKFLKIKNYSLIMGVFNLLPIFPLDGGRILQILLGNKLGVLRANKIILKISKITSLLIIALGLIQVILYPFNMSLLLVGLFLKKNLNKEIITMANDFIKVVSNKNKYIKKNPMRIRNIAVFEHTGIFKILQSVNFESLLIINVFENNKIKFQISEKSFIDYIIKFGVGGNVGNFLENTEKA